MGDEQPSANLEYAWRQQRIWSQTADRLKRRIDQGRTTALWLGIAAAGLAVIAVQIGADSDLGRWVALAAGAAAALVPFAQRRAGTEHVRVWTRARSVSEGLKTEVYTYLARGSGDEGTKADRRLGKRTRAIVAGVSTLQQHAAEVSPDAKPLPDVDDLDSYIDKRVNDQIDWYRRKAVGYKHRASQLRRVGDALAAIAALLGVAAAVLDQTSLAAWVPFLTTVGTSLVAYVAASRYDHMIIEYLRTEQQLEHLRDARIDDKMSNSKFVDACESVISIENQAWMSRWNDPGPRE